MNVGIDLNAIPGERASKGSKVRHNPLVKRAKGQMLGNEYVEVKPIRPKQRNVNHYQRPRVHVPAYYHPPFPLDMYNEAENRLDEEKSSFSRFVSSLFSLFFLMAGIAAIGWFIVLAIDPVFWFISVVLSFLWALLQIIFWIYVILLVLSLVSG